MVENKISAPQHGLSYSKGSFKLQADEKYKTVINLNGNPYTPYKAKLENIECTSGGEGASQCATGLGVASIDTHCEVTCKPGYYACCDDNLTKCRCFNGTTTTSSPTRAPFPIIYLH